MSTRLTAAGLPDQRIKHGSKSRVAAGCTCDVCKKAVIRLEWDEKRKKESRKDEYQGRAVGMTDLGYIVLKCQEMADNRNLPARVRERARYWYNKLTYADAAPATPMVTQSGGRRRSHNARRQTAAELQWSGEYRTQLIET